MNELIPIINEITTYGLHPNSTIADRDKLLEKNLIKIYSLYFDIQYEYDETKYADFDKTQFPNIRQNIQSNFKEFGFYKTVLDINDIDTKTDIGLGDAIDDLSDITLDLLEIKWRVINNSLNDGLWFFEIIFPFHTQQHILDLVNYMKQKNE
jgi:hypothetical protein